MSQGKLQNFYNGYGRWYCGLCPAGYYCGDYATVNPVICPTGKFCPEGCELPSDCPLGTYNTATGKKESRECTFCDAGYFCPILG
jgi:hypothetical protein